MLTLVLALTLGEAAHAGKTEAPAAFRCGPAKGASRPLLDVTALDVAALNVLADDLIPLVERAAGASFTTRPNIGTTDADGLADILEAEARTVLGNLHEAPPHMIEELAGQSRWAVPGILGKYAIATDTVYLGLGPLGGVAAEAAFTPDQALAAVCLVLAHELTHALQDQQAGHGAMFDAVKDMDAFEALRSVSEGHAVVVEERVAAELGLTDVFWALNKTQGWGPAGLEEPGAFAVWASYGQGRTFIAHHAKAGDGKVWEILRNPPPRSAMVFRPATYAPTAPPPPAWGEALAGVEQKLTRGEWAVVAGPLGEAGLRADVAGLDPAEVDDILEHLVVAHQRDLWMPDRTAHIRVLDFDQAEAPYTWLALLEQGQEKLAEALSSPGDEWTVQVLPYDAIQGDAVIRRIVSPKATHLSALETQSVWVVRGERLVIVQCQRFRPGLRLDATLEDVFARLAAAEGAPATGP